METAVSIVTGAAEHHDNKGKSASLKTMAWAKYGNLEVLQLGRS